MTAPGDLRALAAGLVAGVRAAYRRRGAIRAATSALAWAAGTAAGLAAIDAAAGFSAGARGALATLPAAAFLFALARGLTRALRPRPAGTFARLAEERAALGERLATALTAHPGGLLGASFGAEARPYLASVQARGVVPWRLRGPALSLAASLLALFAIAAFQGGPQAALERWLDPGAGVGAAADAGGEGTVAAGGAADEPRIAAVSWRASPPGYSGLEARSGDGGVPIQTLAGSRVRVAVEARGGRLEARVIGGPTPRRSEPAPGRIELEWTLAGADRALELELRAAGRVVERRLVPLRPVADAPPHVSLEAPARDLTLAEGRGVVEVRARAEDDFAVRAFDLLWIRSRGSGESYSFDQGVLPWSRTEGPARSRLASARLDLGSLDLGPGDVLHIRAVAVDNNAVGGPGEGVSDTRTLRVARADEEDLVDAVLTLPAEAEANPILSQRMLILLTERLIAGGPGPDALRAGALDIAREQARLRGRIGEIIFSRTGDGSEEVPADPFAPPDDLFGGEIEDAGHGHDEEGRDPLDPEDVLEAASLATGTGEEEELEHRHDESAVLSLNRDLLAAYNAMWEAERELRQAAAAASLPPQHQALDILQRIRQGERVFARGRQTVPPVDVAAARGTGELEGVNPGARESAGAADTRPRLAALVEDALRLWEELDAARGSLAAADLAARLFSDPAIDTRAGELAGRAADAARQGDHDGARRLLAQALRVLTPALRAGSVAGPAAGSAPPYFDALVRSAEETSPERGTPRAPGSFRFATARYASGDWDSAPLVPANITHSIAQYTDIPVEPEPAVVDLASREVFGYPLLFMTGHLPVRFTATESDNLRAYVERGGLLFIDDHNHDIDAAFHRTVVAELERIFGSGSLAELPDDHELFRAFFDFPDGPPTTAHELNGWGDGLVHESLRAILSGGRIGVLYSNKDYSSQWNYHAQNKRFNAIDDTRFGVNVIVYALTR
ncbi:MAG: DUF4159 domain-containing protein [Gemmatimonadota bacterium]